MTQRPSPDSSTKAQLEAPPASRAEQRSALLVAVVSSFIIPFMGSAVNIALPPIAAEFNLSAVMTNWVATIYLLAAAMFLLPFGRAADIYGRKHIFMLGMVVYTISALVIALAQSTTVLIAGRALQGVGGAMIFGTGIAILTSVYPPRDRGRVLGISIGAVYLGLSIGPYVGGLLTQSLGWRSLFWIDVPVGAGVLVLIIWQLKGEWAGARGERFDFAGAILYGLSLAALMYGVSLLPSPAGKIWASAGLFGMLGFLSWEAYARNPVLDVNLFRRNRPFLFSNLAALANYAATTAGGFLLSIYLQEVKGMPPSTAGAFLMAQPILMTVFSPLAGRASDAIEPRVVASIGMALTSAALLVFSFIGPQTSYALLMTGLVILGAGVGLFSSPNTNAIMSSVEKQHFGVASGMVGTMRVTGQMFSMAITMLLFSLYIGSKEIALALPEFLASTRVSFGIFFVLCLVGVWASLARGKIHS